MKRRVKSPMSSPRTRSPGGDRHATRRNKPGSSADEGSGKNTGWYDVEKIKAHRTDKEGKLELRVKWEGYESKKDLTWEPEESLRESVPKIVEEYFTSVGGRQNIPTQKNRTPKKRKRASVATVGQQREKGTNPIEKASRAITEPWTPPAGSWEDEIDRIDGCDDEGDGRYVVYLVWKNGSKTKHETSVIYQKCPQKMLQFYERHAKIVVKDKR